MAFTPLEHRNVTRALDAYLERARPPVAIRPQLDPGYRIDDPFSETYLSIYQNGVWDFGIEGLDPLFVNPGELVYDYQDENVFMAGNEFRVFDTKNTSVRSYFVESITYVSPYFHFQLKPDEPNEAHLYFDREDINGKFVDKKTLLGTIKDPYGEYSKAVRAPFPGYIICSNTAPIVNRGDALFHISTEVPADH